MWYTEINEAVYIDREPDLNLDLGNFRTNLKRVPETQLSVQNQRFQRYKLPVSLSRCTMTNNLLDEVESSFATANASVAVHVFECKI